MVRGDDTDRRLEAELEALDAHIQAIREAVRALAVEIGRIDRSPGALHELDYDGRPARGEPVSLEEERR